MLKLRSKKWLIPAFSSGVGDGEGAEFVSVTSVNPAFCSFVSAGATSA